ncbi:MAG: hypothetical protein GXO17_06580 [Thermodesulfobacteria bacterium]|nr:hypothetical protein [Thermodesulfobacteriota bacterium]
MARKGFFCPFEDLAKKIPREELPAERPKRENGPLEELLSGVRPLKERQKYFWTLTFKRVLPQEEEISLEDYLRIRVQDTPEYVEELVRGFQRELFEALHQGRISVSRVLNLHRLRLPEAEEAFNQFMRDSLARGDHCVLIVHGRGLSSKGEPILKKKVHEWLRRGPFRKFIIGFCSARQCDGGAGATYVLISPRPLKRGKRS